MTIYAVIGPFFVPRRWYSSLCLYIYKENIQENLLIAQTTRRLGPSMFVGVRNHHRCICEQVGRDGGS